ncbi:MAG: phosphatase PAP2 family protein [Saprospiraceae bacterium]|nr:phosphatase PAP2 family protein [Saprospiraceae bacterium]
MTKKTAAFLSTVGHPFLLLPLVLALLSVHRVGWEAAWPVLSVIWGSLLVMTLFLVFRKRRGKISNWDVSARHERGNNIYRPLLVLITGVALLLYGFKLPFLEEALFFGLLMAVSYIINARIKISQHTLIAFYLAALTLPVLPWTGLLLLCLAPFIAWSRVVLGRHQKNEVLLGALTGLVFGFLQGWLFG